MVLPNTNNINARYEASNQIYKFVMEISHEVMLSLELEKCLVIEIINTYLELESKVITGL